MSDPHVGSDPRLGRRAALLAGAGAALGALALTAEEAAAAKVAQTGWRFCPKCRGLFRSPKNDPAGVCPAGGKHKPHKANNYVLYERTGTVGGTWVPWFRCTKCAGLFLNATGGPRDGVCPKGGEHDAGNGAEFALWIGSTVPTVMDDAWDMCSKCNGLFNWAGGNTGSCPAGGGHERNGSLVVKLVVIY